MVDFIFQRSLGFSRGGVDGAEPLRPSPLPPLFGALTLAWDAVGFTVG